MIGTTVCVEYSDYLSVCLPKNRKYFSAYIILTKKNDEQTIKVAEENNCVVKFHDFGNENILQKTNFNKGLAIEETVQLYKDYHEWIMTLDADIVLPSLSVSNHNGHFVINNQELMKDNLYSPFRYMLPDYDELTVDHEDWWPGLATFPDREHAGYCLLFNTGASALKRASDAGMSWFGTDWNHAGGYDSVFERKYYAVNKKRTQWKCLHLGPIGTNWCGRVSPALDESIKISKEMVEQRRSAMVSRRRKV